MKKGAIELSIGTMVIIVLAVSMLMIGIVLVKSIFEPNYKIYEENCENFTLTCGEMIEVPEMFWGNDTLKNEDLSDEFLNSECNLLQENIWGCNKYLVKHE